MKANLIGFKEEGKIFSAQISLPKQDSSGKVPLVVIVHEWWGSTPYIEDRSHLLNQEGFATLAVDLYGNNQTVGTPREAQSLATPFYQNPQLGFGRLKRFVDAAKADPMVPAKERKAFEKEMKAAKADLKVFSYQGATHAFTNPAATEIGKKFQIPVAYNAKADAASWKELLKFLRGPPPAE
jgi:dienelactone hydrolase